MTRALRVEAKGMLALVQDRGRPGLSGLGVGRSGAADRGSATLANRLVGNSPDAAVIEALGGGLAVRAIGDGPLLLAVTGALAPLAVADARGDERIPMFDTAFELQPGETLRLGPPRRGVRSYLAAHGGVEVPAVLGSRSRDVLAGIGPAPLAAGDVLPIGETAGGGHHGALSSGGRARGLFGHPDAGAAVLDVTAGPRADWFTAEALALLVTQPYRVGVEADRVGVRLAGERALGRAVAGELPSEPVVEGAVQVPSSGQPLVFLADHPVTGGYPVIAVLTRTSIDRAAQLAPGEPVRFRRARG